MSNNHYIRIVNGWGIIENRWDVKQDCMLMTTDVLSHRIEAAKNKKLEEEKRLKTCTEAPFIYNKKRRDRKIKTSSL